MTYDNNQETEHNFGMALSGIGSLVAFAGELMQFAGNSLKDYWLTGHLSDIGIVPTIMAQIMAYSVGIKNRFIKNTLPFTWPIICTFHELYPVYNENFYDTQDIVCYWSSAFVTFSTVRLASSLKLKRSQTLDSILE